MLTIDPYAMTAAFKAVRQRLREDAVLSRVIKRWHSKHPKEPSLSELPYVVLALHPGSTKTASTQSNLNTLIIGIDFAVNASGSDEETAWEDVLNLFGQIEKAILTGKVTDWLTGPVHAVDSSAVIQSPVFTSPALVDIQHPTINAVGGSCMLSIPIKIVTCRG